MEMFNSNKMSPRVVMMMMMSAKTKTIAPGQQSSFCTEAQAPGLVRGAEEGRVE